MKKYIEDNYYNLLNLAEIITKNNQSKSASDLLHITYLEINKLKPEKVKELLDSGTEYLFIYSVMHRQFFMKETFYNKTYNQPITNELNDYDTQDNTQYQYDNTNELKIKMIEHHLNKLPWYDKTLFLMYYFPNRYWSIETYGGKMSYRKLADLIGINYNSIRVTVDKVKKQIIEKTHTNNK